MLSRCRERILRTARFQYPDRIPITHSVTPMGFIKYREKMLALLERFPSDFGHNYDHIDLTSAEYQPRETFHREYVNEWGSVMREERKGQAYVIKPVLEKWENYKNFKMPPPPPSEGAEFQKAYNTQQELKRRTVSWGGCSALWETIVMLRGPQNAMLDVASEDERLIDLMDRLVERMLGEIRVAGLCKCDFIAFCDDWGSQKALLINPKSWRKLFKPRYEKIIQAIHEAGALAHMHSDGYIMDIIPDLIEIGLDGLNPQFNCQPLPELAKLARRKLYILADVDRQYILPFGTPDEVRRYVKKVIEIFGDPAGGFIGRGELGDDVPLENAEAMFQAFKDFGVLNPDYLDEG